MFVPKSGDLRWIPGSMRRQKIIGCPKIRKSIPRDLRYAATDSPYGPAPMMTTSIECIRRRSPPPLQSMVLGIHSKSTVEVVRYLGLLGLGVVAALAALRQTSPTAVDSTLGSALTCPAFHKGAFMRRLIFLSSVLGVLG